MSVGRVLLVPAVALVLGLFGLWAAYRFYSGDARGPHSFAERDFRVYAPDGRAVEGSHVQTTYANPSSVVILVPGRGLDRDWNSAGVYFRSGERLARLLGSRGVPSYRFDPRGTGKESGKRRHFSLLAQAEDLAAVVAHIKKSKSEANLPLRILAHGEGCVVSLMAVTRLGVRPAQLVLVGCGFPGSYLEFWGQQILANMRRANPEPRVLAAGEARMEKFVRHPQNSFSGHSGNDGSKSTPEEKGRTPQGRKAQGPPSDHNLAALERALDFLRSEESKQWTLEAHGFSFPEQARAALRAGVALTLCQAEFDSEHKAASTQALSAQLQSHASFAKCLLPSSNHFLKEHAAPAGGDLQEVLGRASPFAPISVELVNRLSAR